LFIITFHQLNSASNPIAIAPFSSPHLTPLKNEQFPQLGGIPLINMSGFMFVRWSNFLQERFSANLAPSSYGITLNYYLKIRLVFLRGQKQDLHVQQSLVVVVDLAS